MKLSRWRLGAGALAILLISAVAWAALAHAPARRATARRWTPPAATYRVALEDGEGDPLPVYVHRGQTWVLGEQGERYAIRVSNPTSRRVEAVVSVDGRDAVSGRVADYARDRGYVLEPGGSVTLRGFRQSLERVATFRFAAPEDSYSARRGTPENVGVIGVAFFPERARRPAIADDDTRRRPRPPAPRSSPRREGRSEGRGAAADRSAEAPSGLGTEYGESRYDEAREVGFVRASPRRPERIVVVRYDDAEGLEARGIDLWSRPRPHPHPAEPFPGSRFAPPPP
ncbi:MAG: hypothetical protein IT376_12750 [Polyangiaceae bacterium]|nr:hypothetical protein [Polyangiaceae bacterium]